MQNARSTAAISRASEGYHFSHDALVTCKLPIGECRLCNSQVPSYLAQLHVLECPKASKKIINTFAKKFAKSLKLSKDTVYNIAKDHVAYKYADDKVPNKDFKTLDQIRNFCKALDTATDSQTKSFFEQCNLPCSRDVNILKYDHLK